MGGFQWIAELFELDVQAVRKRLFGGKRISLDESFEDSSLELLSAKIAIDSGSLAAGSNAFH